MMLIKIKPDYIITLRQNLGILKYLLTDEDYSFVEHIVNVGFNGNVGSVYLSCVEYKQLCRIHDDCKESMTINQSCP